MAEAGLYDDYIMDHIKHARNYRVLEDADYTAEGSNPLCGDDIQVSLKMAGDRIADIAFQCTCCGISMASASIMTQLVQGIRAADAKTLIHEFVTLLSFAANGNGKLLSPERLAMLETVRKYPSRGRCAVLPWATLERALAHGHEPVILR